jgi:hypothetical protein
MSMPPEEEDEVSQVGMGGATCPGRHCHCSWQVRGEPFPAQPKKPRPRPSPRARGDCRGVGGSACDSR